jgi:hypothetical protein
MIVAHDAADVARVGDAVVVRVEVVRVGRAVAVGVEGRGRWITVAGLDAVDEGPDAFLARIPWATQWARELGLGDQLVSPASGTAAVWWDGMHRIPEGLVLGLPTELGKLARTRLL